MRNAAGQQISAEASLVVNVPLTIITQPASQTVVAGANVNFSVKATGTEPISYQWQFNGVNLGGAIGTQLTLPIVSPTNAGSYQVVVSNAAGSILSAEAKLTVNSALSVVSDFPQIYTNSVPFIVKIAVNPPTGVTLYAIEDQPPTGWGVAQISDGGSLKDGKVKWPPFSDGTARTLSYWVTPPSSAFGTNYFSGRVSFDGTTEVPIGGIRVCWPSDGTIRLTASFITLLGDRFIKLTIGGRPGHSYQILTADSLAPVVSRSTNTTLTLIEVTKDWIDPEPPTGTRRFYQAVEVGRLSD